MTDFRKLFQDMLNTQISFYNKVRNVYFIKCTPNGCRNHYLLLIPHRLLASYKTHWINLMLDKIMVGVGQSVTMDTVQIIIFLVTLILTYGRTILRTTTDFFYFSYELFLCIILNSVIGTLYCITNIIIVTLLIVYTQYYHIWQTS